MPAQTSQDSCFLPSCQQARRSARNALTVYQAANSSLIHSPRQLPTMSDPRNGDLPPPPPPPPRDDPPLDETRSHSDAAPQLSPEQLESLATQVTQNILKQLGSLKPAGDATELQAGSSRASSSSADGGEHSQKGRRGGRRLFKCHNQPSRLLPPS